MNPANSSSNLTDYITIGISLVAIIVSIFTACFTCKANKLSKKANETSEEANKLSKKANETSEEATRVANGEIEIAIGNSIRSTQQRVADISLEIAKAGLNDDNNTEEFVAELKGIYYQAKEANLNAYDEACALYRDKKIDTVRFKKNYYSSIRALVEDNELRERYFDAVVSRYECILEVYKEWHKMEK